MDPQEEPFNDSTCHHCGAELPDTVEPGSPQDEGFCSTACQTGERVVIWSVADLAELVGAAHKTEESIARRLHKDTTCGISFWVYPTKAYLDSLQKEDIPLDLQLERGIGVAGYCEGTDRECLCRTLDFPFTEGAFWSVVEQADLDGGTLWDATHGCPACGTASEECLDCGHHGTYACDDCFAERPVNKDCKACGGYGGVR